MRRMIKRIGTEAVSYDTAVYECRVCGDTRTMLGLSKDAVHLKTPRCDGLPMEQVAYNADKPAERVPLEYKQRLASGTRLWCLIHREKGDPTKHDHAGRSPKLADKGYKYKPSPHVAGNEDFEDLYLMYVAANPGTEQEDKEAP